jgi:hypothetical protein
MLLDSVAAARCKKNAVFQSSDYQHVIYDYMYCDDNGIFHAFQVACCQTHKTDGEKIQQLQVDVGGAGLQFHYLVSSYQYQ